MGLFNLEKALRTEGVMGVIERDHIYSKPNCICVDPALSSEVTSDILQRLPLTTAIPLNRVGIVFPLLYKIFSSLWF